MHAQTLDHLTDHAIWRMQQRAISQTALDAVLRWGAPIEQNGFTIFFLGRRHLPADLAPADAAHLEGTVVVVARDGSVVTTYHTRRVPGRLRYRPRFRTRGPHPEPRVP